MQTVLVNTLDDSIFEQLETFGATLSFPNGNGLSFALGSQDTATVDIMDNDCKDTSKPLSFTKIVYHYAGTYGCFHSGYCMEALFFSLSLSYPSKDWVKL